MKKLLLIIASCLLLSSCSDNMMARHFGGTEEIDLPPNRIVLSCTWKENDLWITSLDTITNVAYMQEKSQNGILEGTIIIK
jgi:hypothetical protein